MIHFVGAGPGAVDLITVRGARLLKEADIIIYAGSLVNKELLESKKKDTKVYNSAFMTLQEVIDVMLEGEKTGKMTVRLHTGDPSIYGAIREQMDLLKKHHIPYEVVPGVSSFCAAAAAVKTEYTLPGVSQTVIVTRAAGRTPVPEGQSIEELAKHKASMIIFLSTGLLKSVSKQLIDGGFAPNSPATIVYKASWDDEKICHTTVEKLEETARENNITKTALVLAGDFLGDEYELSQLYSPQFTHEYRTGKDEN